MTNRRVMRSLVILILLLTLFAQLLSSAGSKSPTVDEPNHLTRGYAYLRTGKLRFTATSGHPPLCNLISALPLYLLDEIGSPQDYPGWDGGFVNAYATAFVFGNPVPLDRLFFLGRLPTMFATLCLAALVARWAGELYGPWGSVVSLVLCAFDPNLIAHGRLVTTDVGITLFFALTVYTFWRFLRKLSYPSLVLAGIALGVAQCVKFSAILLWPVLGLLGLIEVLDPRSRLYLPRRSGASKQRWLSVVLALGGAMAIMVLLAGLTVWAVYRFEVRPPVGWTIAVPAPVYVEGLRAALTRVSTDRPTFLMGQCLSEGRWYYFLVAFALKTPLPSLAVVLLSLISRISSTRWRFLRDEWPLWVAAAVYFAASMRNSLNLGYRHLLPVLPFLWVCAGRFGKVVQLWPDLRRNGKRGLGVGLIALFLGAWLAVGTLSVWPDYLAYFNELAGGPDGGWRYLVDSNLDWGQDLYALSAYMHAEEHEGIPIHLSWFGSTYPYLYNSSLMYRHLPGQFSYPYPNETARSPYNPFHPAPGLYAISATNLQGLRLADGDVFERFRSREPVTRIGHSIFIYEVATSLEQANPTCISGLELGDLDAETIAHSLGRGPGWIKWFDHNASFILPDKGEIAYVLPAAPLDFALDWQDFFHAKAVAVHTQDEKPGQRAATVYTLDCASTDAMLEAILDSLTPGVLDTPVVFDHGLQLLGYRLLSDGEVAPGTVIELVTVWRATAEMPPVMGDLNMFVHLLDAGGQLRSGEDRLDLEPLTWEAGDVLIQYHRLVVPADVASGHYQVALGLYLRSTMRRLAVYEGDKPVADRLLLQAAQVGTEKEE
jgi:4-amino-4-deoxy-L-arabinose transferase-like glycosyltransferase